MQHVGVLSLEQRWNSGKITIQFIVTSTTQTLTDCTTAGRLNVFHGEGHSEVMSYIYIFTT